MRDTGLTKENNEEEWLKERRHGLGGSDCAAIMTWLAAPEDKKGSYEKSLIDLWASKCVRGTSTPAPPKPQSNASELARGHHLEDFILRQYELEHNITEEPIETGLSWHDDYEFIFATPDRRYSEHGVEAKSRRFYTGWGPSGSDEFPLDVEVQSRTYMEVFGYDRWDIACALSLDEIRFYYLERDRDLGRHIMEFCNNWFIEHVVDGRIPEVDDKPETSKALARIFREPSPELRDPTPDEEKLVLEYVAAKKIYKKAKANKERLENRIKLMIAGSDGIRGVARWQEVKPSVSLDYNEFKKVSPNMYKKMVNKYPKVRSEYRKFQLLAEEEDE